MGEELLWTASEVESFLGLVHPIDSRRSLPTLRIRRFVVHDSTYSYETAALAFSDRCVACVGVVGWEGNCVDGTLHLESFLGFWSVESSLGMSARPFSYLDVGSNAHALVPSDFCLESDCECRDLLCGEDSHF